MQSPDGARRPLTWLRLQIVATLALMLALLAIMAVIGVIIPPVLIFAVILGILAYALRRWAPERRWLRLVGAVLALLVLLLNLPFIVEDLLHPESALVFLPTAISVLAALVAVLAGVVGFMRLSEGAARPVGVGALAVAAVLAVVAAGAALTLESDVSQAGDVVIVAEEVEYPEAVQATAGSVALFVENRDPFRHTFAIESRDVEVELPASTDRRVVLDLPAGSYDFKCTVPGHDQMAGVLTVTP
jgi:plastocyanin